MVRIGNHDVGGRHVEGRLNACVDAQPVADLVHGRGDHAAFAGQALHILAEIVRGVPRGDVDGLKLDGDMRFDQCIHGVGDMGVQGIQMGGLEHVIDVAGDVDAQHLVDGLLEGGG